MKKGWLWIIIGLFVAGLAFGGYKVYSSRAAAKTALADAKRYITAAVGRQDVSLTVSGSGPAAAAIGVNVKPQQTGIVDKVLAHNGDKVQANQPVVVLRNSSVAASLANSQAALQQAQENLANALNVDPIALQQAQQKVNSAQSTVNLRQTDAANLAVTSPVDGVVLSTSVQNGDSVNSGALIANIFDDQHPLLSLNVPQYIADLQQVGAIVTVFVDGATGNQKATLQQIGPVVQATGKSTVVPLTYKLSGPMAGLRPGAGAHATLKDSSGGDYIAYGNVASSTVTVRSQASGQVTSVAANVGDRVSAGAALATLKNDSLQAQLVQAQSDLTIAQAQLANLLNPGNAPGNNIPQLQLKLKAAQADLATKLDAVDQLTVRAPFAGTIGAMNLNPGDSAGQAALFRVSDYTAMTVSISVDELDISRVKLGQAAQVSLDALQGQPFSAKVTSIDPEGVVKNDIANFGVTLTLDKVNGLLAGMNAVAIITVDSHKSVVAVPVAAVQRTGRNYTVRVMDANNQPKRQQVKVGLFGNEYVEILEGVKEGDKIVLADTGTGTSRQTGIPSFGGGGGGFGGGRPADAGSGGTQPGVRSSTGGGQRN